MEDRFFLRGARSFGFSAPAPITSESRLRRWTREAGNWSQRNESTVIAESFFDARVMEDGQHDDCLANPSSTCEGSGCQVFREANDFFYQFTAPETGPRRRRWGFSGNAIRKSKTISL